MNGKRWNGKLFDYWNTLICEVEVLNGEIQGKGKEYFKNGKLSFEGEYLNGYRWNGKGYDENGNLQFEIKNGKGKGRIYYSHGYLRFEGEYLNGKKHGKGKEFGYHCNLEFEGEYANGERNGKGKEYFQPLPLNPFFQREGNSLLFEGEYLDGKRWNGKGYQISQGFNFFDFEIKDGKGKGKEYENNDSNKLRFEGEYINGERNGKGKEYAQVFDPTISNWSHRYFLSFEGEYLNGKRNGKGK